MTFLGSCDFEAGLCGWVSASSFSADLSWVYGARAPGEQIPNTPTHLLFTTPRTEGTGDQFGIIAEKLWSNVSLLWSE